MHGILVQLPLPEHINEAQILKSIRVDKDADGFAAENAPCPWQLLENVIFFHKKGGKENPHLQLLGLSDLLVRTFLSLLKATFFFQVGNLCLKGGDPPLAASQLKNRCHLKRSTLVCCVQRRCRAHQLAVSSYYSAVEWQWLERQQQFWAGGPFGACRYVKRRVVHRCWNLRSNLNGMPMAQMLLSMDATVTTCHSKTANVEQHLRNADIVAWWDEMRSLSQPCAKEKQTQVVVAIGQAEFVRWVHSSWVNSMFKPSNLYKRLPGGGSWLKPGCVVIDVGINSVSWIGILLTRLMVFKVSQVEISECRGKWLLDGICWNECMFIYLLVCIHYWYISPDDDVTWCAA